MIIITIEVRQPQILRQEKQERSLLWQCLESITYGGYGTAMKEDYTDIIQQASQLVFEAIKDREENLLESVKELDREKRQTVAFGGTRGHVNVSE
ncbi:MAG: hypothetical protein AAF383_12270 [Cyanobacteria bacterium P01_A01_bin.83]